MKKVFFTFFLLFALINLSAQINKQQISKFKQVFDAVTESYADSVDKEQLIEDAIRDLLKKLDPHSLYFSKDEVEELNRGLKGSFVGVGISYDIIQDTVLILSVVENGPSYKAGIQPGDRIIEVENECIAGTGISDKKLRDLLIGKKGTKVNLRVKRRNSEQCLDYMVVRGKIPLKSVNAAYNITKDISYLRLNRFSATAIREFKKATDTLMNSSNAGLILDLRYNSGGYLYAAVQLLEFFLNRKTLVLYTEGVHQRPQKYYTLKKGKYRNNKLIVLINEASASASEIVAGAIQDLDRGIIIGRRSFGKGLVQKPIFLNDSSLIRLTIAKYYTPSGRNIQKSFNKGVDAYNKDLINRFEHGEHTNKDSINLDSLPKYKTLFKKRVVFGGGGIMPDVFIPVDTGKYPSFYTEKVSGFKINEAVHLFVEKHRTKILGQYPEFNHFLSEFELSDDDLNDFFTYVCEDEDENEKTRFISEYKANKYIKSQIKALIASDLWGAQEYYKVFNPFDETILKAVELLSNNQKYSKILSANAFEKD